MLQFFVDIVIRPECVYTCMTGAMSKDNETGLCTYMIKADVQVVICV